MRLFSYLPGVLALSLVAAKDVYISMSTMPARIDSVEPVLHALLNQTVAPKTIFISIPYYSVKEDRQYKIPEFVTALYPQVQVLRDTIDWGPATKFITPVKHFKDKGQEDALLIILDDDQLYPRTMVQEYLRWHEQYPDAALTLRGHKMVDGHNWAAMVFTNIIHAYELSELTCVDIVTGVGSFMVQPRFFTPELWEGLYVVDEHGELTGKLREDIRTADDIWISGLLAKNKVKRYAIPGRADPITPDMELPQFLEGTILPQVVVRDARPGTRQMHLLGGRSEHNDSLLQLFKEHWDCYGRMDTMVRCSQLKFEKHPHLGRMLCRKDDGGVDHGRSAWAKHYGMDGRW